MSVMLSAASAVQWAAHALGLRDEAALLAVAQNTSVEQHAAAPLFLPYLSGERTPHNDPHAQGALVGLTHSYDAAALAYAVVEGVSFGLLDGYRTLSVSSDDEDAAPLSMAGGGSRSEFWVQLLASLLDRPLSVHAGGEAGGALGAARLGWLADGGSEDEVCRRPPVSRRFEPLAAEQALLAERHARFRSLYAPLRAPPDASAR